MAQGENPCHRERHFEGLSLRGDLVFRKCRSENAIAFSFANPRLLQKRAFTEPVLCFSKACGFLPDICLSVSETTPPHPAIRRRRRAICFVRLRDFQMLDFYIIPLGTEPSLTRSQAVGFRCLRFETLAFLASGPSASMRQRHSRCTEVSSIMHKV